MADQSNNIAITITDGVSPSIEPKIAGIAATAAVGAKNVADLQAALDAVNGGGIAGAATAIRSASQSTSTLATNTQRLASVAASAQGAVAALATSCGALETQAGAAATAVPNLATATAALNSQSKATVTQSQQVVATTNQVNAASNGAAGGIRNMSATLNVARGNIGGANRIAASFLNTLVGSSAIMEAAFAVAGPLALAAVLAQVYQAVEHVVEAYHDMQLASIQASNQAIVDGEKIQKVKAASIFSASGVANLFTDSPMQQTISVVNAQAALKQIESEKQLAAAQAQVNEAGLQGEALAKQRATDSQTRADTIKKEITQVQALQDAYRKQSEAVTTVQHAPVVTKNRVIPGYTTTAPTITDPNQQKAIQTQISATANALQQLNTELGVTNLQTQALEKKEPLAGVKDEAKAAQAAMKNLNDQYDKLKQGQKFIDPTSALAFWKSHANDLPGNKNFTQDIDAKTGAAQQQVDRQNDTVATSVNKLGDQLSNVGAYSDALKIQQMLEQQVTDLERQHITVSGQLYETYLLLDTAIVQNAGYQAQLTTQYNNANGPLRTYTDASAALFRLYADGAITTQQWEQQTAKVTETYNQANLPLLNLARSLSDAAALQGTFGNALTVATQQQAVVNELRQKGITLSEQENQQLHNTLTGAQQAAAVNQGVTALWEQQQGALEKLVTAQQALNAARQASIGVDQQKVIVGKQLYDAMSAQNAVSQAQLAVGNQTATMNQQVIATLGPLLQGYKGFGVGANAAFGQFFSTLDNGFADAIGRAVAFGQSFSSSVMDVARQAVAGLISSLVKLGVQWVVTEAIGATLGTSAAATTTALATTTAAAWAPAAAFASLATLGANAAPADAAIASTTALTLGLSALKLSQGGPVTGPGTSTSDSIPALLSNGEYVIKASAYRMHKSAVEAINGGAPAPSSITNSGAQASGTQGGMSVEVHNYSGSPVQVQHMDDNRVRMIVGQEAPGLIQQHAPGVIATNIANPNGTVSKAIKNNVTPARQR